MTSIHSLLHDMSWADWTLPDPGASGRIRSDRWGIVDLVSAAAETRTLNNPPRAGIMLGLNMVTDGGDIVITVEAAINATGNNTITLNDAGDFIVMRSRKFGTGFRWVVVSNDGASLSTV